MAQRSELTTASCNNNKDIYSPAEGLGIQFPNLRPSTAACSRSGGTGKAERRTRKAADPKGICAMGADTQATTWLWTITLFAQAFAEAMTASCGILLDALGGWSWALHPPAPCPPTPYKTQAKSPLTFFYQNHPLILMYFLKALRGGERLGGALRA